jgi:hypothetical protein
MEMNQIEEAVETALKSLEQEVERRTAWCAAEVKKAKAEERERCAKICEESARLYQRSIDEAGYLQNHLLPRWVHPRDEAWHEDDVTNSHIVSHYAIG